MAQELEEEIGTVNAYIGDTITLTCNLKKLYVSDFIIWYHLTADLYISYDDTLLGEVPQDLSERLTVTCQRAEDLCTLTIREVQFSDNGTYQCGYGYASGAEQQLTTRFLTTGQLMVTPSPESPTCDVMEDGELVSPKVTLKVGDTVSLFCSVTGASSSEPSLSWLRNYVPISVAERGYSASHPLELTEADIGVAFTCLMSHPALENELSCSLMPLPDVTTTPSLTGQPRNKMPTLSIQEIPYASPVSLPMSSAGSGHPESSSSPVNQLYFIPTVVVVFFVIVAIIWLLLFLAWRHKRRNKMVPVKKPNYRLTFNGDVSITAEGAAVHYPDSIDNALQLSRPGVVTSSPAEDQTLYENAGHAAGGREGQGTFPLYAKPDKTRKPQLHVRIPATPEVYSEGHTTSEYVNFPVPYVVPDYSDDEGDEENASLMYAELDLTPNNISRSNSPRLPNKVDIDATIYADITGTL